MSREEIQKLLGGYATDTLSETERRALFEAALEDQELFDALAKEQALRDVLQDPLARRQLIAALEPSQEPLRTRAWRWLRQPAGLAVAASLATLLIVTGVVWRRLNPPVRREVLVAQVKAPAPAAPPEPTQAPVKEFQPPVPKRKLSKPAPLPEPPVLSAQEEMKKALSPAAPPAPQPASADTISAEARVVREQTRTAKASAAPTRAGSSAKGAATTSPAPAVPAPAPAAPPPAPLVSNATAPAPTADLARQLYSQSSKQTLGLASGRSSAMRAPALQRAGATPPLARNLGVRYGLLLKGTDDEYSPVALDTVFHSGDAVRLRLEPNDSGYIYLFQRDATGGWRLASTQRVEKGQRCLLPVSGALQYDQPGSKQLLLVFSRQEDESLAALDTAELDALASNARANILKATVSSEESGYAVDTRTQASQQKVAFEITLEYR